MLTWPAPHVPTLPGAGATPQVHDTSAGALASAAVGPTAAMYVCGITPYDATHVGHAATYVAFDLLHRALLDAGVEVRSVQNVTDVDDPLLERAAREGVDWAELAERETDLFREDMSVLAVLPPTRYVAATEAIPAIVDAVLALQERGAAYEVEGDVYFSVAADPSFGAVAHLGLDRMLALFAERGGDPQRPGKKDPLDPLLWQAARPGEPAWRSPLGLGRPGWHIECTAIALNEVGAPIDVQGGGRDLAFPHHEMGASHGHVLTARQPFARVYVHAGMVGLDGEKMSKSRGNLVFVSRLRRDGADPMAVRLALLAHHYRSDWEWTSADLPSAEQRLAHWRVAVSRDGRSSGPAADAVLAEVRAALADDLDAPRALAAVDRWADAALAAGGADPDAPGLVARTVDALLGVRL